MQYFERHCLSSSGVLFCDTVKCGPKEFETVGGVIDVYYASLTFLVIKSSAP